MITFPLKRTRRIAVEMRELTLDEAASVCRIPHDRPEQATTTFLRAACANATRPTDRYVTDPRLWTVEERAMLTAHYIGTMSPGGYDFSLGRAHLSDYLLPDQDLIETEIVAGDAAGESWLMVPILGIHAELLEQVCTSRADWVVGMLACQMRRRSDTNPVNVQDLGDVEAETWLREQMSAIRSRPESEVEEILALHSSQRHRLRHYFIPSIGVLPGGGKARRFGIVFIPTEHAEAGVDYPVTFLAVSGISETTRRIFALDHGDDS